MNASQRHNLPFISPGQAQKELFHNEALQMLDALVAAAVEEPPRLSPPASPVPGACYIVAGGATGDWQGRDLHIAAFTAAGWRYVAPTEGMSAFIKSSATTAVFIGGAWEVGSVRGAKLLVDGQQVVGARTSAIGNPSGGSTIDAEARAAIIGVLAALRQHGLIAQ